MVLNKISPSSELSLSYLLTIAIVQLGDMEGKTTLSFFLDFLTLHMTHNFPLADIIDKHSGRGQLTGTTLDIFISLQTSTASLFSLHGFSQSPCITQ